MFLGRVNDNGDVQYTTQTFEAALIDRREAATSNVQAVVRDIRSRG